ncbi:MAG: hypothetical protein IKO41_21330 [Lachnospiraceae bacterium]|nr:hypothetical protein [Lachnospiraceae bacterium]
MNYRSPIFFGIKVFILLFVLITLFLGFYTIDQGYRGVLLRFGKLIDVVDSGLHFKFPWVDSIKEITVRTQKVQQKLSVYSKDVQGADVLLSVNYAISPESVGDIYTVGGMDYQARIIQPQLMSKPKDVFGKYNAVNIVQNREKLTHEIYDDLVSHFKGTGIIIQSVQVENIDFSDSYERSVEERMKAEVEVQRVQQNLERERINADMVRAKAQGEADAKLARATADAKAIEIQGKAEAEAIRAKADAMAKNPDYIRMLQAERWDGKLPQTMLPNSAIPIIK